MVHRPPDAGPPVHRTAAGNETWIAAQLEGAHATGSTGIAGINWKVYDQRARPDTGNLAYAMSATRESSSYVLYGTAQTSEFEVLAKALAQELDETRKTKQ